ncbi:hypothetical protein BN946_scf185007.g31 [Trametes cinnabarina]|uniref:Homeobox domain-containing protein n=1 Tax=Pycnoporus cinnabarinus TaxID=5643 RepID=A0A060SEN0_PYCCI|nr:hypothetical protein BN946_scf185007.g31 [Trametes cinnabarina]
MTSDMPSSPRKSRSSSRLASAAYDEDSLGASPATPYGVSSVPVMKASSMEPVRGRPAGDGKRSRHKMTDLQLQRLEELYQADTHPSRAAKEALAAEIGIQLLLSECRPVVSLDSAHVRQTSGETPARIARSPSSSLESVSSDDAATPHALWKFIISSPPPPPPVPNAALHAPHRARQPFGDVQGSRQHKPDLEWACANSAARRKHGYYVYRDEDDSEGESSELEGRSSAQPVPRPNLKRRRRQRQPSSSCGNEWASAVPEEYEKLFPPDLVLGANLLLTLKHSAGPARL